MNDEIRSGGADEDRPRFLALSLTLAALCALSWWLMGGGEMLSGLAEQRGGGTAAGLAGAGFAAVVLVLYVGMRLFHWGWTRSDGAGDATSERPGA